MALIHGYAHNAMRENFVACRVYPTLVTGTQAIKKNTLAPGVGIGNVFIVHDLIQVACPHAAQNRLAGISG
ncbi:MAG TPA: hypothetical protein DD407_01845 [Pseudohongiella sp.]|nr:hypothetical protein [Pseudohongiella sp.]